MKLIACLLLTLSLPALAAFVAPAEGPVPFRRDKLPIDADTMRSLSRQLLVLAQGHDTARPADQRAVAQMLALAVALDPAHQRARDLSERLVEGGSPGAPAANELELAKSRVWNLHAWLTQPEAGADGQALAACLADALVASDPEHPQVAALREAGEQGRWGRWVAPLESFRDPSVDPDVPVPPTDPDPESRLAFEFGSMSQWLWQRNPENGAVDLVPVEISMRARTGAQPLGAWISFEEAQDSPLWLGVSESLQPVIEKRHGPLPAGFHVTLSLPQGADYWEARNLDAIHGTAALLADSVFSGTPPVVPTLATVAADGSLGAPARYWRSLRQLADSGRKGRLILPVAVREDLPSLLTLDDAELFLNQEILLADDAAALFELAGADADESLRQARAAFAEIQAAKGTRSIGSFLAFPSTQQRLQQVIELLPEHASARMLALRGTSKWPQRLPPRLYAREIRTAIEPLGRFTNQSFNDLLQDKPLTISSLLKSSESIQEPLAEVERLYGSVKDRDQLHQPAMVLAKSLIPFANELKRYGSRPSDDARRTKTPQRSFAEIRQSYLDLVVRLTRIIGDEANYSNPWIDPELLSQKLAESS